MGVFFDLFFGGAETLFSVDDDGRNWEIFDALEFLEFVLSGHGKRKADFIRSASGGLGLANRIDRLHFGAIAVFVVVILRLGGFDIAEDNSSRDGKAVVFVELWELGLVLRGVFEISHRQHEAAEVGHVVWSLLAGAELRARDGQHVTLDHGESCADGTTLGRGSVFSGLVSDREELALATLGFDNLRLVDDKGILAFHEEGHGGIDVVKAEAEG